MTIRAEITDKRIAITAPFRECGPERAKRIPGRRWDDDNKANTYPLTWATCVALRKEFGNSLQVGPKLTAWAWEEHARNVELEKLRAGENADLPRVRKLAPALWEALQNRPYQIAGAAFVAHGKRVCLGDEPRLGKTYQTLAALVEAGSRTILIACPQTVTRTVWMRKISELAPVIMPFVAQEDRAERERVIRTFIETPYDGPKALIVNKEMIRVARRWLCPDGTKTRIKPSRKGGCKQAHSHKAIHEPFFPQLHDIIWDAVVLDECHHALATEKNVQSDNISQLRMGAVKLKTTDDAIKLGLSGTPFRARLTRSWGVLNWLRPDVFGSFWAYAERHFGVNQFTYEIGTRLKDEQAFDSELRPYYLARSKADVAPQLPPIDYVDLYLPMLDQQARAYRSIVADGMAEIEGGRLNANGVLAELTRMRQFASTSGKISQGGFVPALPSNKLDWVIDFLKEREALQSKVVIATQFTKLARLFATELRGMGHSVVMITGDENGRQRDHAQDEFLTGSSRIAIINMFAGGEGIDLSSADELIFLDEPWTDDVRQQAESRITNLAKTSQLTVYHLRSEGTVEEWIASLNDEQRAELMKAKPKTLELMKEGMVKWQHSG